MRKPLFARARLVLPRLPSLLTFGMTIAAIYAFFSWVESRLGQDLPIKSRVVNFLVFYAAIHHALFRVFAFHPAFRPGYRAWLELTPWTSRKPLPLGPVELVWEDGLVLGPLILLCHTLPVSLAPQLLCTFLLVHLLAVDRSLWLTRSRGFAYATAFGLGLAVWTWGEPIACLFVLAATYAVAYDGLRRALARFPWHPRGESRSMSSSDTLVIGGRREVCGWPHDRMMADVIRCPSVRLSDAFWGTALSCWWFYVLLSLVTDPADRSRLSAFGFGIALVGSVLGRLAVYSQGCTEPMTVWARIRTNRWIIPSFDRVIIAPVCSGLVGGAILVMLHACGVPAPAGLDVAGGMTILAALITPPSLRQWRLTGGHRIVPTGDGVFIPKYKVIETN